MASADWFAKIKNIDAEKITERQLESLISTLEALDISEETNVDRLRQLFYVTWGTFLAREDQLKQENDQLEKELQRHLRTSSRGGDAESLQDTLKEMDAQREQLEAEVNELRDQVASERKEKEDFADKVRDLQKEMETYKERSDMCETENRDLRKQLEQQLERNALRRTEGADSSQKMNRLQTEIRKQNIYIDDLERANQQLNEEIEQLKSKLALHAKEMNEFTDEYARMKVEVGNVDQVTGELRRENAVLKQQVTDLQEQVYGKRDTDDYIMAQVNAKIEEFKAIVQEKDLQLLDYHRENQRLKQQVALSGIDTERASLQVLTKAVEERDREIKLLRGEIERGTRELQLATQQYNDLQKQLEGTGGSGKTLQLDRIKQLQDAIRERDERVKEEQRLRVMADKDAAEKETDLLDALDKLRKYETGTYGLEEATNEIRQLKKDIKVRDKQAEELVQYVNRAELRIQDVLDENEQLRLKLGMDPSTALNLDEFKRLKSERREEDRANVIVLEKEVEQLEEERSQLKKRCRLLARQLGQKAANLGLTADNMVILDEEDFDVVDDRVDRADGRRLMLSSAPIIKRHGTGEMDELRVRQSELSREANRNAKELEGLLMENGELKARVELEEAERKQLEAALIEVHNMIKQQNERAPVQGLGGPTVIECPALEKLLAALEAKQLVGDYNTNLYWKARLDNLQGRCDQLRIELREARVETASHKLREDKANDRVQRLTDEIRNLRDMGAGMLPAHATSLPDGIPQSSADIIASLNEHLVHALQELRLKEDATRRLDSALDQYKRKFAIVRHMQSCLYADHLREKAAWNEEKKRVETRIADLELRGAQDKVHVDELARLQDVLAKSPDEIRVQLAELSRRATLLSVNEQTLIRKYQAVQESETWLRRENTKLNNEQVAMEKAVAERISYLQRYKEIAGYQISSLQKQLEESVPQSELEQVNRKYTELTEKYRTLLEEGNERVSRSQVLERLEAELKQQTLEKEQLKRELLTAKEKCAFLEQSVGQLEHGNIGGGADEAQMMVVSRKIAVLEMKELNERERANHFTRLYENLKLNTQELESHTTELQKQYDALRNVNLEMQKAERELRDELACCVTREVHEAERKRFTQLEKEAIELRAKVSKLQDMADIAVFQARTLEQQQMNRDKEVASLRQQLIDLQSQTDERALIGKLHRHIVQMQISEGTALRKLDDANKKVSRIEADNLRLHQRLDEKDQHVYINRMDYQSKTKHLKRNLQALRIQYAGAIPLSKQERFTRTLMQLEDDRRKAERALREARDRRAEAEDRFAEVELKNRGLEELIAALKDTKAAQKIQEWHSKLEQHRLEELKLKRVNERSREDNSHLETVIRQLEQQVAQGEEERVRAEKRFEERELQWEQRELELERIIASLEHIQAEISKAAGSLEGAGLEMPDVKQPAATQLEQAINIIKKHVKTIFDLRAQVQTLTTQKRSVDERVGNVERQLLIRDRLINELKLRLPASVDKEKVIQKINETVSQSLAQETAKQRHFVAPGGRTIVAEDYESEKALRVAQTTISSLQTRLDKKEETIHKLEALLKQSRDEIEALHARHQSEIASFQSKLHAQTDESYRKFKDITTELMQNSQHTSSLSSKQLARLNELEELLIEQQNAAGIQSEQLRKTRREIDEWRRNYEALLKGSQSEKDLLLEDCKTQVQSWMDVVAERDRAIAEKNEELQTVEQELRKQKEENDRAPNTVMKRTIEKLKRELAEKEEQQKSLNKAVVDLRAQLVSHAVDSLEKSSAQQRDEATVGKYVAKHTQDLATEVDTLRTQLTKARDDLKKARAGDFDVQRELDEARVTLDRKERDVARLKNENQKLNEELDNERKKFERVRSLQKRDSSVETMRGELDELRRKNRFMEEELRRLQKAERPLEFQEVSIERRTGAATLGSANNQEKALHLAKWEETKKLQLRVDKLQQAVREKDSAIERLEKQVQLAKMGLERSTKDREVLEHKLKGTAPMQIRVTQDLPDGDTKLQRRTAEDVHSMETLRQENFALQDELDRLRVQNEQPRAALEQQAYRMRLVQERNTELEKLLAVTRNGAKKGLANITIEEHRSLLEREQHTQAELLKLNAENIECRLKMEQFERDLPRLRERVADLNKYVEFLKNEKQQLLETFDPDRSVMSNASQSSNSSVKRIGESGKSARELEKTIAVLKKLVERTQQENERLKKLPGTANAEQLAEQRVEVDKLRGTVAELQAKLNGKVAERAGATDRGVQRMIQENEKLRKDAKNKETEAEKLKSALKQRDEQIEMLRHAVGTLKQQNGVTDSVEGDKSILSRVAETKLRDAYGEIEKKNQLLNAAKDSLRESAQREQALSIEKQELLAKLTQAQRLPAKYDASNVNDKRLVEELERTRAEARRLEAENRQLHIELDRMAKASSAGLPPTQSLLDRLRSHESVLSENVDLKLQLRDARSELDKRRADSGQLRPEFYEELEELKANYQRASEINARLRQRLIAAGIDATV